MSGDQAKYNTCTYICQINGQKKVYIYHISGLGQNRSSAKGRGNFIALFYTFLIAHQSTNKKDPPRALHETLVLPQRNSETKSLITVVAWNRYSDQTLHLNMVF